MMSAVCTYLVERLDILDSDSLLILASSVAALFTGFLSMLVISTDMMGATDMTVNMPKPSGAPTALLKPTPMDITKGTVTGPEHETDEKGQAAHSSSTNPISAVLGSHVIVVSEHLYEFVFTVPVC